MTQRLEGVPAMALLCFRRDIKVGQRQGGRIKDAGPVTLAHPGLPERRAPGSKLREALNDGSHDLFFVTAKTSENVTRTAR